MMLTSRSRTAALLVLASLIGIISFFGWILDQPLLRGFGFDRIPIWPLTAIGFTALALGHLAAIEKRPRLAATLWLVPLLISGLSLLQGLTGIDLGTDRILFGDLLATYDTSHQGRTSNNPISAMILLAAAGYMQLSGSRGGRAQRKLAGIVTLACAIAAAILGLAAMTAVPIVGLQPDDPAIRFATVSLPTALLTILIAVAVARSCTNFDWLSALAIDSAGWRWIRGLLPVALVIPILPSLFHLLSIQNGGASTVRDQMVVLLIDVLLLSLIGYWAALRIAREQAAQIEIAHALRHTNVVLARPGGEIVYWSRGCEALYGWSAGEAIGRNKYALLRSRSQQWGRDRPADSGTGFQELMETGKDGRHVCVQEQVHCVASPLRGALEVHTIHDVTARVTALAARETHLRSILEAAPYGMVVIDELNMILRFSCAAEQIWGYGSKEVVGKDFTLLLAEEERERFRSMLWGWASGTGGGNDDIVSSIGEACDGHRFPVEVRLGVAHVDGEKLFTFFFRDISKELESEERLADLHAELAHVSRQSTMSELAADIAHELNQPLAAANNFLAAARRVMANDNDPGHATELLKMAGDQTIRASEIIRRLRNFLAKHEVEVRAEPLNELVQDAIGLVRIGSGHFDIRFQCALDPAGPQVLADRVQVQQVIVNLLRNAIEALRHQPRAARQIRIATRRRDDEYVEVELADSGPGLPREVLDQLHQRFTSSKKGGMGVGLSICHRIVVAHGGQLTAENRPEGGARFRFTLRAARGG